MSADRVPSNCTKVQAASHNRRMTFRLAADAVLVLHLLFVLFVVLGGLAVLRWPRLAWLHVPAALWGVLIEFGGWICPLTPLENSLRERGGEVGYSGGFIDHYVTSLIYPDGLTRSMQVAVGALVLALNAYVYWRLWRQSQRGSP
jgi:hypothetical protein